MQGRSRPGSGRNSDACPRSGRSPDSVECDLATLLRPEACSRAARAPVIPCSNPGPLGPTEVSLAMPSDAAGAGAGSDLPDIDDHLVEPGTRYEMLDGKVVYVPPSDAPHGERQFELCALVAAHTGSEVKGASDLLTRTSKRDDVAPDVSVYPGARDPNTGRRQLAQIAFEVVSTQSLGDAGKKAASLISRGVRRVFAIDVERARVLEWSAALGTWSMLDAAATIADPALAVPLPIETLIREGKTDDAVMRALAAKHNPVLETIKASSRAEGIGRGKAEAVVAVLEARGVPLDPAARDRILGEQDLARLERWIVRAIACASAAELLAGP
ncbi:MAG: Uma2 family endonuclease [Deltaproteobacteria bacterium]|nr:MAG: Uma2 family endonuclease [Deltaproteobacteria bacterium]